MVGESDKIAESTSGSVSVLQDNKLGGLHM